MTTTGWLRGLSRLLAAALLAASALLPAVASPARAADITFGTPEADVVYTEGITFSVPLTASVPPERVELRLSYPGSLGPFIEEVPAGPSGDESLSYRLDLTGDGHLVPNSTIEATWAAFPAGGGEPVLSKSMTVRYEDTSKEWRTLKGDLVVVHWYDGSEAFARRALRIGDDAVKKTADLLGVTETEPIDFFIYGDEAAFRTALGPGTRENVGGQAHADIRTLFALIEPSAIDDTWVRVVVPHELTHLVFDTAVRQPVPVPAALGERGAGGVPVRGVHARRPEPRRGRRGPPRAPATDGADGAVPDGPREDVPRLRRGRVRHRPPRAHGRRARAVCARRRVRGRPDR